MTKATRVRIFEETTAQEVTTVDCDGCPACKFAEIAVRARPEGTTMRGSIAHVEILDDWTDGDRSFKAGTIRRVQVLHENPIALTCVTMRPDEVRAEREKIRAAIRRSGKVQA